MTAVAILGFHYNSLLDTLLYLPDQLHVDCKIRFSMKEETQRLITKIWRGSKQEQFNKISFNWFKTPYHSVIFYQLSLTLNKNILNSKYDIQEFVSLCVDSILWKWLNDKSITISWHFTLCWIIMKFTWNSRLTISNSPINNFRKVLFPTPLFPTTATRNRTKCFYPILYVFKARFTQTLG